MNDRKAVISETAKEVLEHSILIDGHCDTVLGVVDEGFDPGERHQEGHLDFPRMREGGQNAQFFACWSDPEEDQPYLQRTLTLLDALHRICDRYPDQVRLITSASEVREGAENDMLSMIPAVEGGHAMGERLENLRTFYRLGVRYMTLTWMNSNQWADGSGDDGRHGGLTDFGREVVREMNRLGMMVDVSHVSKDTFRDALDTTRVPVIASHSCCRALHDHHRNLTDAQLQRLAENGGVIGICFYPGFLDPYYRQAYDRWRESRQDEGGEKETFPEEKRPRVPLSCLLDHIDHAVEVAGIEHVGLGSDFDGIEVLPDEIEDCSDIPLIVEGLIKRGYDGRAIQKILGENFLRVFHDVEEGRGTG